MSERVPEAVRQQVRNRASQRCEYCRKPEGTNLYPFHVDHIIPPLHGGNSEPNNLAWSCFQCNITKGSNIASYDLVSGELTPIYNPRTQAWVKHFEFTTDGLLVGKSPEGRVTIRVLQMNHPEAVSTRLRLIKAGRW